MTPFFHAAVGAAIGDQVERLYPDSKSAAVVAIATAFASHFLTDMIVHLDPGSLVDAGLWTKQMLYGFLIVDHLAFLVYLITRYGWRRLLSIYSLMSWCAFAAYCPDIPANMPLIKDVFLTLSWSDDYIRFHSLLHAWRVSYPMPEYWIMGIATQFAALGVCFIPFHKLIIRQTVVVTRSRAPTTE